MKILRTLLALLVVLLSHAASCRAARPSDILTDSATVRFLIHHKPDKPSGIVIIQATNTIWNQSISRVQISVRGTDGRWHDCPTGRNAAWVESGVQSIKVSKRAFKSQIIDSLRIPASDSAIVLTFGMMLGSGVSRWSMNDDTLIQEHTFDLAPIMAAVIEDDLFPNRFEGVLVDESTGQPIKEARIYCGRAGRGTTTDDSGRYVLNLGSTTASTFEVVHPLYDTVKIYCYKDHLHSTKRVDIQYQGPRSVHLSGSNGDEGSSGVLLAIQLTLPPSGPRGREERPNLVYTYDAGSRCLLSSRDTWTKDDCPLLSGFNCGLRGYSDWIEFLRFFELAFRTDLSEDGWSILKQMPFEIRNEVIQNETGIQITVQRQPL